MRSVYWLADQPHGPVSSHQGLGSVTAKNRLGGGVDGPPVGQIILDGNAAMTGRCAAHRGFIPLHHIRWDAPTTADRDSPLRRQGPGSSTALAARCRTPARRRDPPVLGPGP